MSVIPIFVPYSQYIKKKDINDHIKARKYSKLIVVISSLIVIGMMQLLIVPKLGSLFSTFGVSQPFLFIVAPILAIVWIGGLIGYTTYVFTSKDYTQQILNKANKYKDDEMINVKELGVKSDRWFFLFMFVGLLAVLGSYIFPIYQLTSHIK